MKFMQHVLAVALGFGVGRLFLYIYSYGLSLEVLSYLSRNQALIFIAAFEISIPWLVSVVLYLFRFSTSTPIALMAGFGFYEIYYSYYNSQPLNREFSPWFFLPLVIYLVAGVVIWQAFKRGRLWVLLSFPLIVVLLSVYNFLIISYATSAI